MMRRLFARNDAPAPVSSTMALTRCALTSVAPQLNSTRTGMFRFSNQRWVTPRSSVGRLDPRTGKIDLLRNEIIVVQQPFGGRRDAMTAADGLGHNVMGIADDSFVFGQPMQQPLRTGVWVELMDSGQRFPVVPQLFQTKQLGAQGRLGPGQRNAAAEPMPETRSEATDLLESE